jgi:glycosyltransferase involved in cell wall biosynthesis
MSKPLFVISSPFDCYSGYGARSRDVIKAIIETDKYNVKLLPQRWGNTPWGFCKDNPEWGFLLNHNLPNNQLTQQPEIWMQITIPSEFQPVGKYNIGVTAGIETTVCAPDWIEGLNRMNLNLVSSNHSKKVFEESKFERRNQQTNQVEGMIQLQKPVEVLFEGANLDVYKVINQNQIKNIDLDSIKEDFAYLFLGHWINGDLGEDRKNVGLLIKAFYELFKNRKKRPALILKTSMVSSSYMDREEILKRIKMIRKTVNSKDLPNIYLLHGEFTDTEINELYNHPKVKAMVNLTRGEGFGRPLLEFSLVKKPIITTNWSGHTDFLNPEFVTMLPGQMTNVHPSAANQWLIKESQWLSVDQGQVGHYMRDIYENYKNYTENAKRQAYYAKQNFTYEKMVEKMAEYLKRIPEFPKQVSLVLPSLPKRINLPKLNKIEPPNK